MFLLSKIQTCTWAVKDNQLFSVQLKKALLGPKHLVDLGNSVPHYTLQNSPPFASQEQGGAILVKS